MSSRQLACSPVTVLDVPLVRLWSFRTIFGLVTQVCKRDTASPWVHPAVSVGTFDGLEGLHPCCHTSIGGRGLIWGIFGQTRQREAHVTRRLVLRKLRVIEQINQVPVV